MAWIDVPSKMTQYGQETYAPDNAEDALLSEYDASGLDDVPLEHQYEFEEKLDYRLGACVNLRKSKAMSVDQLRKV